MRIFVLALLTLFALPGAAMARDADLDLENTLYLDLKDGRVVIKMYPAFAPKHVERIKMLTRQGYYDGSPFHRVIEGFMVQTGSPADGGVEGAGLPDLQDEYNIRRHWRGVTSMANTGEPNSANSQFFIMLQDNSALDNHYTVWGRVIEGMRYVDHVKKGDPEMDGLVEEPERIVRMQIAADVEGVSTPDEVQDAPLESELSQNPSED